MFLSDNIVLSVDLIRDFGSRGFTQVTDCIPELIFNPLVIRLYTKIKNADSLPQTSSSVTMVVSLSPL